MITLLLLNAASTLVMFGVILTIQFAHYPLFTNIGDEQFRAYHEAHMRRRDL